MALRPRRARSGRAKDEGLRGRPHRRREELSRVGERHRRARDGARRRGSRRVRSRRAVLLRRRLRGLAHARPEAVRSGLQQPPRIPRRMAGLAETRRQERDRARIVTPILTLKEALASPWLTVRVQIATMKTRRRAPTSAADV